MLKFLRISIGAMLLLGCMATAWAQQNAKIPKIGYLGVTSASPNNMRMLRQGFQELGYIEGKNIALEFRWGENRNERLPELAADLVRQKVDVIVTSGGPATRAAMQVTSSVPIVMALDTDPVGNGFVASLAQPGGNVTGNSSMHHELIGKQMELLKILLPRMSRVAVLGNFGNLQALKEAEAASRILGLHTLPLDVREARDIEPAMDAAARAKADAILVLPIALNLTRLSELAVERRLPVWYSSTIHVDAGGLAAYSTRYDDLYRRAAIYVDKILKGRKPADLPVEQPTRFELVLNMKTAKAMGLTVPQSFLLRVDRMIE